MKSRPPAMRSAAACCAGTGSTSPAPTVWAHCLTILPSASRKARTTMTGCRIFPARAAGSSWTPPSVCVCCWTRKRMRKSLWICWETPAARVQPAAPATPCARPATKQPTPPTRPTRRRRRSCSTKPSNVWRMPMRARPSGKTSWPAITVRQRSFCPAAGQRSLLHPAVHRLKKSLPPAVHPARAQGSPRATKQAAAALPARERQRTAIPAAAALQRAVEIQIVKRNGKIPAIRQS